MLSHRRFRYSERSPLRTSARGTRRRYVEFFYPSYGRAYLRIPYGVPGGHEGVVERRWRSKGRTKALMNRKGKRKEACARAHALAVRPARLMAMDSEGGGAKRNFITGGFSRVHCFTRPFYPYNLITILGTSPEQNREPPNTDVALAKN